MHAVWVISFSFSAIFAFAFSITGLVTLISLDDREQAEIHRELAEARKQGWIQRELRAHYFIRHEAFAWKRLAEHWRARRDARKLIGLAALFVTISVIIGCLLGAFQ